jgi:hypothetical protein
MVRHHRATRHRTWLTVFLLVAALLAISARSVAAAETEPPIWKVTSVSTPTNLLPTGESEIVLRASNIGGSTDGSTVTVIDSLPSGLTATQISGREQYGGEGGGAGLECSSPPALTCTYTGVVVTGDMLIVSIKVTVDPGAPESVLNQATVSGGGAENAASVKNPATISATPAAAGIAAGSAYVATSTRQAGAHPDVTTEFSLNTAAANEHEPYPSGNLKDAQFNFPAGLVGSTVGMTRCSSARALLGECPASSIVGIATTKLYGGFGTVNSPVFNIAPSPGEPVAFEFPVLLIPVRLDTSVSSGKTYEVRVTAGNISEALPLYSSHVVIWGVPADHQAPGPIKVFTLGGRSRDGLGSPNRDVARLPLLDNPTRCDTPWTASLEADQWETPGAFDTVPLAMDGGTGCDQLPLFAGMSMLPDTLEAGAPAGYTLDLHIPQNADPNTPTQADVKRVATTLPMGTVISPSAALGLKVCSDGQFGLRSERPAECPRESQVGTVQIATPSLVQPLTGEVYLAEPQCTPCAPTDAQNGKMVGLLVQAVAEGEAGVLIKLRGSASIDQQTGQITATFDENPQAPFSDFKLALGGGPRATLVNPRTCGPATTTMQLTPWTTPFTSDVAASSTFAITGCQTASFNPAFVAGTTNIQAGEFSPFTLSFGRTDKEEFLNGLQMRMPPGLLGSLAKVPLCKEPQATEGACGQESLIGHTQVLTGAGADPFLVSGGEVFLTGGYKGASFGLSIVVPAVAGPYTLAGTTGRGTVVVRAAIDIDPHTAALTVTADPLPTALDGIPLQLKRVDVAIDRPEFTFNPTNCSKLAIDGSISSKESAAVPVSTPFQVTNCTGLGFRPKFTVRTSGRTSRLRGASLDARVVYPSGSKLANIARVKVELPKQLPSRLTTLQKACPAAAFEADPGSCPPASVVGIAKAVTPILPVPLSGPVYFVSHGGEAFPNLIVVLQGYGVRFDLVGATFISKAGITSSTFENVPDVPISSFELYLPEGKNSALAANGNLCTQKLVMPTVFVGQNGDELRQSTPIGVTGCAKHRTTKKNKRARSASRHRRRHVSARRGEADSSRQGHTGDRRVK